MTIEERLEKARNSLYGALLTGSPQRVVDAATELLGNPMMVMDNSLGHVALSEDRGQKHAYWRHTVETKEWDYKDYLANRDAIRGAMERIEPVIDRESCPDGAIIEAGIGRKGECLGFLAVFECDTPVSEDDLPVVQLITDSLALLMRQAPVHGNTDINSREAYLLYHAALRSGEDGVIAGRDLGKRLGLRKAELYSVLKVGPVEEDDIVLPSPNLLARIDRLLGNCRSFLTRLHGVLLVGHEQGRPFLSDEQRSVVEDLFAVEGFCAGMSYPIHDLGNFRRANYQAGRALSLGRGLRNGHSIYEYYEFAGIDVSHMVMSQCDVFDLIDPRVLDLVTYDGEKGSEYLLSLWEYLRSNGSMSEACSALCIHRNTLGYRLSRINALFSLDVRSVDDRVAAMHAMGLLLAPAGGSFDAAGIASIIQAMGEGSE
jgi:hypothetical protein